MIWQALEPNTYWQIQVKVILPIPHLYLEISGSKT